MFVLLVNLPFIPQSPVAVEYIGRMNQVSGVEISTCYTAESDDGNHPSFKIVDESGPQTVVKTKDWAPEALDSHL